MERFEPAGGATNASQNLSPPLAPPAPEACLRAFNLVRRWINIWEVDGTTAPVASACVTLHFDGEVLARAESVAPPGTDGRGVIESAVELVLQRAEERLPFARDALWEERRREAARSITFTLELGGLGVPIEVASFRDAALRISPGMVGVGARLGTGQNSRTDVVFPLTMLASGLDAGAALSSAAAAVLEDGQAGLAEASVLADRGVRFLAFDCVVVAEIGQDRAGAILHRGGRVFETRDVTSPMLQDLGGHLSDALAKMRENPSRAAPSVLDDALAAYALARWAATPGAGSEERIADWLRTASDLLARAGTGLRSGDTGVAGAVVWLMAESELHGASRATDDGNRAEGAGNAGTRADDRALVRGLAGQIVVEALDGAEPPSPPVAVMAAWAGARRAAAIGDIPLLERCDAVLRGALSRTPPGDWVGLMPWVGWAEHELASARARLGVGDPGLPAAAALRELRTLVWRHQIGATDVGATDRDLVGGIVFTRGRQPLPTWHSLRPLAYLATMIGEPSLTTEEEYVGQVIRMLSSLRFLRQLCADEAVCAWADGATEWGVRAAVWTDEQPDEATAMGLLVIGETLRSLDAVTRRRAEPSTRPAR